MPAQLYEDVSFEYNFNQLVDRPKINNTTLSGSVNKKIVRVPITKAQIENITGVHIEEEEG